jgi:FkbM family methyltransferase
MVIGQILRWILPPVIVAGVRWVRSGNIRRFLSRSKASERTTFKYGDYVLQCDSSHHLPRILELWPDFGRNLADIVLALQVHEPRVIDVGANIGDTALLLARFAAGARVLCIEGDSQFIADLKVNTAQITGVTLVQAILSDHSFETRGKFVVTHGTAHLQIDAAGDAIRMVALDDLLKDNAEFSTPDLIKVDTDGFDVPILRGGKGVLMSSRPVVFYEWHPPSYGMVGENDTNHADFLMSLGYHHFIIYTNKGEPLLMVEGPKRDIWESLGQFSRGRQPIDDWHYDIAAFPSERLKVWIRLAQHYSSSGIYGHLQQLREPA